jgi:hypothetical protein
VAADGPGGAAGGVLQPLDSLGGPPAGQRLLLTGQLVAPDDASSGRTPASSGRGRGSARKAQQQPAPQALAPTPLLDWVVDYGPEAAASGAVWAVTEQAWYRLVSPSSRYAPVYASTLRKARLACSAAELAGSGSGISAADLASAVERAAAAQQAEGDAAAKQFVLAQLEVRARLQVHDSGCRLRCCTAMAAGCFPMDASCCNCRADQ